MEELAKIQTFLRGIILSKIKMTLNMMLNNKRERVNHLCKILAAMFVNKEPGEVTVTVLFIIFNTADRI